jgi:hypothetical protein
MPMIRVLKSHPACAVLMLALLFGGCASLIRIDVTGEWQGSLLWTSGPSSGFSSPMSLSLAHEDRDVAGTVTLMGPGSQPFTLTITDGVADAYGIEIHASGTLDAGGATITVSLFLEGDYDEQAMSGTGTQSFGANSYAFTWELVRISGPPTT